MSFFLHQNPRLRCQKQVFCNTALIFSLKTLIFCYQKVEPQHPESLVGTCGVTACRQSVESLHAVKVFLRAQNIRRSQ